MPKNNRSAKTGRFVSSAYTKKHASTTVSEQGQKKATKGGTKSIHRGDEVFMQTVKWRKEPLSNANCSYSAQRNLFSCRDQHEVLTSRTK